MGEKNDEPMLQNSVTEKLPADRDTIRAMKDAGLEKPKDIRYKDWNQIEELSKPKYHTIAYLAVRGLGVKEIAEAVSMSDGQVRVILDSERMKFEIKHLQYKLIGQDVQKRFKSMVPAAIDILEEVMQDESSKPATKLDAAKEVMDRALGKPQQNIKHEGSLIRELFEKMDGKTIDVKTVHETVIPEDKPLGPIATVREEQIPPKDDVDEWASKNL